MVQTMSKRMGRPLLPRKSAVAKRLTAIREKLGLTQAETAEKLGVSKMAILRWELGMRRPDARSLTLISLLENGKI